ncbi:uncharacterized protein L969DRAFT_619913 [Mixia osmundae IAM 14324]|uniref:D-lactate dehydrogenase (cytochrome) n=1 Tax=Mixia osmundae (strain CBS 9802 / IAM 14324 / JCM 22182 / KY 12970) TaxID=764103 RepID=G7E9Y1_MIXOS|nr:uncharacterized protein L969DRAFT_619913 [Mixia osmundae IAM 14324]KEI40084.1 hypothetical protein L969DRAFT_619913 [Mixia osmundae IAM 14324]GAA99450.1 hypothetical protein E5Q_06149 [Mixia osmundae IAM 14324]
MSVRADGLRRVCVASRRCLQTSAGASQRVHPLQPQDRPFKPPSLRPSSRLESARLPNGMRGHKQRWSTLTLIMLATVTGSSTYALALLSKSATNSKAVADELAMPNPTQAQFDAALEAAKNVVGHENCTTDQQELVAHGTSDWSYHMTRKVPGAVLYPNSTDDVVRIVKIAKLHGIPIVPFAGGTSLEGQFMAPQHGVPEDHKPETDEMKAGRSFTLDFANMTNILAVHAGDLDAVVQPGLTYDDLNEQLKDRQLFFPVDPGPGACIGGMIGTGCSGTNAVRYGTMRENVIAMKVVMADGQVVTTRSRARKSSAGPNLGQLFLGSEGTLGIVTEATLKLYPVMPTTVSVISFPSVRAAADAAAEMVGRGVGVACLELLDDVMMKAVNKANALDKTRRQWAETASLFIKFSGNEAQMNHDAKTTREIVKRHGSLQVTFAKDKTEADELWQSRKVALWSALSYLDDDKTRVWTTDVCVPITNLPALIEETQRDLESAGLIAPMVGHVGDGNFHALILFRNDDELKRTRAAVHRMVERAQTLDGTCTGEHSVGVGKREYLAAELGQPTVEVLRKLKQSLDPQGIFNPGKLYPGKDIKH